MADYDVNALAGTVMGIAGAGVVIGTLGRMTNMVFDNMPQNRRQYKKQKRRQPVYTQGRDNWGRVIYVPHYRI